MCARRGPAQGVVRRRVVNLFVALALAAVPSGIAESFASASIDYYFSGGVIYDNTGVIDTYGHYLTLSYVHYLGTGNRWPGAGAYNYANFVWGYNEVSHPYGGSNYLYAEAWNASGHDVTANAHADY